MDYLGLIRKARAGGGSPAAVAEPEPASKPAPSPAAEPKVCFHCGGTGRCDCIACGEYRPRMVWSAGECRPCKARKGEVVQ